MSFKQVFSYGGSDPYFLPFAGIVFVGVGFVAKPMFMFLLGYFLCFYVVDKTGGLRK